MASYKLILDRMVGSHSLHKNVAIVAAGNRDTDNAVVQPMSTALQSRLVHLDLTIDYKEWCEWATTTGLDHKIVDYIMFKPDMIYTFKPDHTDHTYACPRTWEFANRVMKQVGMESPTLLPMLAGTISEGVAREFLAFTRFYQSLPKMSDIQNNPLGVPVPKEPAVLFALSGSISYAVNEINFDKISDFVERMPTEFQVITLKNALKRHPVLTNHPSMKKWYQKMVNTYL